MNAKASPPPDAILYSVAEAAGVMGMSEATFRRELVQTGAIPVVRYGRRGVRVRRRDLDEWAENNAEAWNV